MKIEADLMTVVVQMITEGPLAGDPQEVLVVIAKILLACTSSIFGHIYRETNQNADHLARLGAEQTEDLVVTEESPQFVCHFVLDDILEYVCLLCFTVCLGLIFFHF